MTTIAIPAKSDWHALSFGQQLQLSAMISFSGEPVTFEDSRSPSTEMLDELAESGYLVTNGEGTSALYKLTEAGEQLAQDIPECMRPGFQHPATFGF